MAKQAAFMPSLMDLGVFAGGGLLGGGLLAYPAGLAGGLIGATNAPKGRRLRQGLGGAHIAASTSIGAGLGGGLGALTGASLASPASGDVSDPNRAAAVLMALLGGGLLGAGVGGFAGHQSSKWMQKKNPLVRGWMEPPGSQDKTAAVRLLELVQG